jgi:hypothetical protein
VKEVTIEMERNLSNPLSTLLRHLAFKKLPCWRPIAIFLGEGSNLMYSPSIVEDPFRIIANLETLSYSPKIKIVGDCVVEEIEFTNKLFLGGDAFKSFNVSKFSEPLITSPYQKPISLKLVFRLGSGGYSVEENRAFLMENVESYSSYTAMNSHHSNLSRFDYQIEEKSGTVDRVSFKIESLTGDEDSILSETISQLDSAVAELRRNFPS